MPHISKRILRTIDLAREEGQITDDEVKIYFPNRKEYRFLSNPTLIQAYNQ